MQSEILSTLAFVLGRTEKESISASMRKSWKKAKEKLRRLTSRSRCGSIIQTMEKIKVYMRGWLNYYGIADMKNNMEKLEWMAVPTDTDVYLETVEAAQNQNEETDRFGGGQSLCGNDSL